MRNCSTPWRGLKEISVVFWRSKENTLHSLLKRVFERGNSHCGLLLTTLVERIIHVALYEMVTPCAAIAFLVPLRLDLGDRAMF